MNRCIVSRLLDQLLLARIDPEPGSCLLLARFPTRLHSDVVRSRIEGSGATCSDHAQQSMLTSFTIKLRSYNRSL